MGSSGPTVIEALTHLIFLTNATEGTRRDLGTTHTMLNEFAAFQYEIRLLHRGIMQVLVALGVPASHLSYHGLRINEQAWAIPPPSAAAALEEVQGVLRYLDGMLTNNNMNIAVPGYDEIFNGQFTGVLNHIHSVFAELHEDILEQQSSDEEEEDWEDENPMADAKGATQEEINSLEVHTVTAESAGAVCSICLEQSKMGEEIRILPCSHSFHKVCIDTWLANSATCPIDRTALF